MESLKISIFALFFKVKISDLVSFQEKSKFDKNLIFAAVCEKSLKVISYVIQSVLHRYTQWVINHSKY